MDPFLFQQAVAAFDYQNAGKDLSGEVVAREAQRVGVPKEFLEAIIRHESNWDPQAVSPKGAKGLMQLMPATARAYGVKDPHDPEQNIRGGASYIGDLYRQFEGDLEKVAWAYNAGPGRVRKGVMPKETQAFVPKVMTTFHGLVGTRGGPEVVAQELEKKPEPTVLEKILKWVAPGEAEAGELPNFQQSMAATQGAREERAASPLNLEALTSLDKRGRMVARPEAVQPERSFADTYQRVQGILSQPEAQAQEGQPQVLPKPMDLNEMVLESLKPYQKPINWATSLLPDIIIGIPTWGAGTALTTGLRAARPILGGAVRWGISGGLFGAAKEGLRQVTGEEELHKGPLSELIPGMEKAVDAVVPSGFKPAERILEDAAFSAALPLAGRLALGTGKGLAQGLDKIVSKPASWLAERTLVPAADWTWDKILAVPFRWEIPKVGKSTIELLQPAISRVRQALPEAGEVIDAGKVQRSKVEQIGRILGRAETDLLPSERYQLVKAVRGTSSGAMPKVVKDLYGEFQAVLGENVPKRYQDKFNEQLGKILTRSVESVEKAYGETEITKHLKTLDDALAGKGFSRREMRKALDGFVRDPLIPEEVRTFAKDLYNLPADTPRAVSEAASRAMREGIAFNLTQTPGVVSAELKPGFVQSAQEGLKGLNIPRDVEFALEEMKKIKTWAPQWYENFLTRWKTNKVVMRPAAQFRNLWSNFMLNDIGGLPWYRMDIYKDALKGMRQNSPGYREFVNLGGGTGRYSVDELAYLGHAPRYGESMWDWLWRGYDNISQIPKDIYGGTETWFKYAKYLHNKEKGMGNKEALLDAMAATFNYGEVTPFVAKARLYPLPFVTWWTKAIPHVVENAVKHPLRVGKYVVAFDMMRNHALEKLGLTESEFQAIQKNIPEWMQGGIWLPMPWRDDRGNMKMLNLTWMVPGIGDIAEIVQRGQANPWTLAFQNPLLTAMSVLLTKTKETGAPLYYDWEKPETKLAKTLSHLWMTWSPAPFPGNIDWKLFQDVINERPDALTLNEAIGSQLGFRLTSLNPRRAGVRKESLRKIQLGELNSLIDRELREATSEKEKSEIRERYRTLYRRMNK